VTLPSRLGLLIALCLSGVAGAQHRATALTLQLEVRHICGDLAPQFLEVLERSPLSVIVPKGCPGAGRTETLLIECTPGKACSGSLTFDGTQASVRESAGSLIVETPRTATPNPLAFTAIAIVSKQRHRIFYDKRHALWFVVSSPSAAGATLVEPGLPGEVHLAAAENQLGLSISFDWMDDGSFSLQVRTTDGRSIERRATLGERISLPCPAGVVPCASLALTSRVGNTERR